MHLSVISAAYNKLPVLFRTRPRNSHGKVRRLAFIFTVLRPKRTPAEIINFFAFPRSTVYRNAKQEKRDKEPTIWTLRLIEKMTITTSRCVLWRLNLTCVGLSLLELFAQFSGTSLMPLMLSGSLLIQALKKLRFCIA